MRPHQPLSAYPPQWSDATIMLPSWIMSDLDAGLAPVPLLAAFEGEEPVGIVALRPFESGELLDALIEVLALLLPLGADRLALAIAGRAWSLDEPIAPVQDEVDLRAHVIVVSTADAHEQACEVSTRIAPLSHGDEGWHEDRPVELGEPPLAPALSALGTLLDSREELQRSRGGSEVHLSAQLGRVLLLGHELALAPPYARRLEVAAVS